MAFPNPSYPLVGDCTRRNVPETEKPTTQERVYAKHGFPANFWLPTRFTRKWKTSICPLHNTNESIQQWQRAWTQITELADISGCEGIEDYEAFLENDLKLIQEFNTIYHEEGATAPAKGKQPKAIDAKGKRGRKRPTKELQEKREKLRNDWIQFKEAGAGTKKDFCKDRGISLKHMERVLACLRKKNRDK